MVLRTFVRLRTLLSATLFLVIAVIAWGCASTSSSFVGNQTAQGVKITVTPTSTSVPVSGTQKFTASVANTSNTAVIWQVNGVTGGEATHGTIDATGLYKAPPTVPSPSTVAAHENGHRASCYQHNRIPCRRRHISGKRFSTSRPHPGSYRDGAK